MHSAPVHLSRNPFSRTFLQDEREIEISKKSFQANAYFPVSVDNIVEGHQFISQHFSQVLSLLLLNDFYQN